MCWNTKVLAGSAAALLGVLLIGSQLFGRALPLVLLAVCPLSMMAMMRSMRSGSGGAVQAPAADLTTGAMGPGTAATEVVGLRAEIDQLRAELDASRDQNRLGLEDPPVDTVDAKVGDEGK